MGNMLSFVGIIIIVFGILQIILFFKVWGMTNNVNRIKNNIIDGADTSFEAAKKEFMLGNPDKAFEIYNKCFVNDIVALYNRASNFNDKETYEAGYKEECKFYEKKTAKLGDKYSIDFSRFDTFDKIDKIMSN